MRKITVFRFFMVLIAFCILCGLVSAESADISQLLYEEYGTELRRGTLVIYADTSTSMVVDWRGAAVADPGEFTGTVRDLVYKQTTITDGHRQGEPLELRMRICYYPDAGETRPVILFIPGGGFRSSVMRSLQFYYEYFAVRGYVTAVIEYRTIGEGRYMDGVADIRDAVRFLRAHAEEYGIDTDRVGLFGGSAGGHMAALAGVAPDLDDFRGENNTGFSSDVRAVICLCSTSDLTCIAMDMDSETQQFHMLPTTCEAQYVNGVLSGLGILDDPEEADRANPITYLSGGEPAFLHLHGDADNLISPSMSLLFHNALLDHGDISLRYVLHGENHGSAGFYTEPALQLMSSFFEIYLKR